MDFETIIDYNEMDNSLLVSALVKKNKQHQYNLYCETPIDQLTNNLGMISGLYIYTNTPPHGYGSQGPKVAETVKRAYSYNLKKSNKVIKIGPYFVERLNWEEEDGPFPMEETHGNFLAKETKNMAIKFLKENCASIDSCVNKVMEKIAHSNSDVLTKGRQTLDSFTNQSVTASVAYKRMYDFYQYEFNCGTMSCLEWIRNFFLTLSKESIHVDYIKEVKYTKTKYDKNLKIRVEKEIIKTKLSKKTLRKEEVRPYMMDFSRSFASYLKHKERGKLNRRAIASANVVLRMFLYIIEEFHLELGKYIQGSTISVGGEEKKAKIINNLGDLGMQYMSTIIEIQGTEDATKWNECLSPAAFAIMHKVFFDSAIRDKFNLSKVSEYGNLFQEIAISGHFLMAIKRIQMGVGPIAFSNNFYNRLDWEKTPIERFNKETQNWLGDIREHIKDGYLTASPGMLMGMLNAGSTTYGLMASGYGLNRKYQQTKTLRSSDDSTTLYIADNPENLLKCVEINRRSLAALGINLSLEKTFFYEKFYSEYTSWYQDQGFVSQFGVETSAIRPQGNNPPDDFYGVAKGTATGLSTLTLNHIGATARLILGLDGVRRIWRIRRDENKREGINSKVIVLSDGGTNLWDSCNCHLEEISLREREAITIEDKNYLQKICNPKNPFSPEPIQEVTYSKDTGRLTTTEIETPRTIFHFMKRSNRTVKNSIKENIFKNEKINSEISKIVKTVIPTTLIKYPTEAVLISRQLIAALSIQRSGVTLTEEEEAEFQLCIDSLKHGRSDETQVEEDQIDEYDFDN
uniref:RNA-directed RNA polymerase catalytic subunit n=1 Tax=Hymenopteran orthomyxo-related virus OKIAV174 TaxID=2792558 RepID=A0A7T0Q4P2_9ORTO|nr:polymerase PB1 [Hymenopteran orthomyxo-related virus OKIAV174]